jgi:hypothetical protein
MIYLGFMLAVMLEGVEIHKRQMVIRSPWGFSTLPPLTSR